MADISRAEVATLIAEEYANTLLDNAIQTSVVLEAFPRVDMGSKVTHMPVLATLPEAAWVGESATAAEGVKPTSQVTWDDRTLVAEEVAVIIPVHENVVDDATVAVLENLTRQGGQAIGRKLDQAVLFGIDKPASWTSSALLPAAVAAGQTFQTTTAAGGSDLYGAHFAAAEALADAGYDPTDLIARAGLRFRLANLRDAEGGLLLSNGGTDYAGLRAHWARNGSFDSAAADSLIVDASRVRIGVRQDITVKFLDQATVGGINLAERDMVALRFKARFAYVLGTGATPEGASMVPVAAVIPAATTP